MKKLNEVLFLAVISTAGIYALQALKWPRAILSRLDLKWKYAIFLSATKRTLFSGAIFFKNI